MAFLRIIIGGDIAPKDHRHRTVQLQKEFLKGFLLPLIADFRGRNGHCDVFLIMGNDDFRTNYDFLKEHENGYAVLDIHPRNWKGYALIGYPFVPYTPFIYKDWEKADLTGKKEHGRSDILLSGVLSTPSGLVEHSISLDDRKDSIEKDMFDIFKSLDPRKIILVIHTPPFDTKLDLMDGGRHVGSEAVRKMIIEKQPLLTLHGHIHECVRESGSYMEIIGETYSLSPGNDHRSDDLAVIEVDPAHPWDAKRIVL